MILHRPHFLFALVGLAAGMALPSARALAQGEDLKFLTRWFQWADARNFLQSHLNSLAFEQLQARRQQIATLKTAEDWKRRQAEVRRILEEIVGPFPEKTPLNPRVLGRVEKRGYRIEKLVFESRPNFFVTACLFLPSGGSGPRPAILNVIGHTDIAFRAPSYQQLLLNLVQKGFVVLAMDPIGQGERLQYYDPQLGRSLVGRPTQEHSYLGKQCFLVGSSAAHYFTWDGIRAIDYLVSRPEVDPARIGVTGISGGGTQTSYVAALDERVLAAAPTCYICGFQRLLESIGPQDAEQNFNRGLARGIDHADLLEVRAPRPTLVTATTRDFFSIQGARETVAEARRAFEALGAPDHLSLVEDDHVHGYTRKIREAIYRFFQEHLRHPGNPAEEEVELLSREELRVTPTGQLIDSLGGQTVYTLNRLQGRERFRELEQRRQHPEQHLSQVPSRVREISGYQPPEPVAGVVFRGRYRRAGYVIEQYVMEGKGILPFLFFLPEGVPRPPALLYLHPQGKSAAAEPGGELEQLAREGYAVLAPDLSGCGEWGEVDERVTFLGVQTGRSLVGIRAGEIVRSVQFLKSRADVDGTRITALARGGMAIPLLHAALFDPSIRRLALVDPLISFRSVVEHRFYTIPFADLVPNALTAYDLPDLQACLAPRSLLLINPQDPLRRRAVREWVEEELNVVRRAYASLDAEERFQLQFLEPFQDLGPVLSAWLRGEAETSSGR